MTISEENFSRLPNREWYRFPKMQGQAFWADPYLDVGGGNVPLISYSVPVRQQEQFVGVIKMDILLDNGNSNPISRAQEEEKDEEETNQFLYNGVYETGSNCVTWNL